MDQAVWEAIHLQTPTPAVVMAAVMVAVTMVMVINDSSVFSNVVMLVRVHNKLNKIQAFELISVKF